MSGEGECTILFVADSSDALTAAEELDDSYGVETARTAEDAVSTVDEDVDALVVEAYLPDRSGEALLTTLRRRDVGARAAVLAPPTDGEFPEFDLRVETPPTPAALHHAVGRLLSLRAYDDRVDHLYELARRQSRRETTAPPVGDGGFDAVDDAILDARAAADSALTDVRTEDHGRLFVDETRPEIEDDSR